MAARKKATGTGASRAEANRATAVVLEQLHGQFKAFGEGLGTLREQMQRGFDEVNRGFAEVGRRFQQVDLRFAQVDQRFEQIDQRFEQVDRRFEQMDQRFEQMDQRFARVEDAITEHGRQLRDVRVELGELRVAVDKKVDRQDVEGIVERAIARAASR